MSPLSTRSCCRPAHNFLLQPGCVTTYKGPWTRANCIGNGSPRKQAVNGYSSLSLQSANCSYKAKVVRISKGFKKYGVPVVLNKYSSNSEDGVAWWDLNGKVIEQLSLLYKFSRPHTIIGTVIGITSVSILPVETLLDLSPLFFIGLVKALVPSLLMNIYIVGLNQLFDVEIDKVNKPYLPIASGEFSMRTGITIVLASLVMSLAMGFLFKSPPLLSALLIGFVLGSAYSVELPLLRWKKQPFLAASCILIVRAIVIQFAFFVHMQKFVLGKPLVITKSVVFAAAFMCFFSAVIALFKDIPDVDGDRNFGIRSFSVSLGQQRVFWLCVNMLLMAYGAAVVVGASSFFLLNKLVIILGHCTLAFALWIRARSVDLASNESITSFYMFIWKVSEQTTSGFLLNYA
ncbi:hypothetical protein Tsubulata_044012 [Turnera subulata]|uniref:Homogentisate phytyltransferase n=1 Tax=Turnera subulata TaxID=218843 RepID=A0A9Q0F4Z2_9ROSI|nr:hypothetical protein Tsubulata_044012 [Turnera subulata]